MSNFEERYAKDFHHVEATVANLLWRYIRGIIRESEKQGHQKIMDDHREVITLVLSEALIALSCALAVQFTKTGRLFESPFQEVDLRAAVPQEFFILGEKSATYNEYCIRMTKAVEKLLKEFGFPDGKPMSELDFVIAVFFNLCDSLFGDLSGQSEALEGAHKITGELAERFARPISKNPDGVRQAIKEICVLIGVIASKEVDMISRFGNQLDGEIIRRSKVTSAVAQGVRRTFLETLEDFSNRTPIEEIEVEDAGVDSNRLNELLADVDLGEDTAFPWREDARYLIEENCWDELCKTFGIPRGVKGIKGFPGGVKAYEAMLETYKEFMRELAEAAGLDWDEKTGAVDAIISLGFATMYDPTLKQPDGMDLIRVGRAILSFEERLMEFLKGR